MVQTALRIESPALSSAHTAPFAVSRPSGVDITDRSLWSWLLERPSSWPLRRPEQLITMKATAGQGKVEAWGRRVRPGRSCHFVILRAW